MSAINPAYPFITNQVRQVVKVFYKRLERGG